MYDKLEIADKAAELKIAAKKARAIMATFNRQYVEPAQDMAIGNIKIDHDNYVYTAAVLIELISDVLDKAGELEQLTQGE